MLKHTIAPQLYFPVDLLVVHWNIFVECPIAVIIAVVLSLVRFYYDLLRIFISQEYNVLEQHISLWVQIVIRQ